MMKGVRTILYLLMVSWVVVAALPVYADDPPQANNSPDRFVITQPREPDSLDTLQWQRNDRLYDSLRVKSHRSKLAKAIYKALFRGTVRDTTHRAQIYDEAADLRPYAGKEIKTIQVERLRPFNVDGKKLGRIANNFHTLTRTRIIYRDLLFSAGDRLDPDLVVRNEQLLEARQNIAEVDIRVDLDPLDTNLVVVVVRTRDSWTVDVDAGIHSGGEFSFGLSESNLWGRAHELRIETNIDYRHFRYGGNLVEYHVPNMWGSFYDFKLEAGKEFDRSRFGIQLTKPFLKTTDYEIGGSYLRAKERHRFPDRDTTELINSRRTDLWGGYTHYLPSIMASTYLTGRYQYRRFLMRPDATDATMNPALHDRDLLLAGLGVYRENFHTATMIYGYGKREYLSSGFRSEVNVGYRWGEYREDLYLGLSHTMGGFTRLGYMMGRVDWGSYLSNHNQWHEMALDVRGRWFSNLFRSRRTYVRQFFGLGYTQGWERLDGADEWLEYTKDCGLAVLDEDVLGTTRLVLNAETIFFTPYEPLGFKIAIFSFIDAGLLGFHENVFRNEPYFACGVGVRVRNERLVFPAIQIRLGVSFGRTGWADSNWINASSEIEVQQFRYTPQRPDVLLYK